MAKSTMQRTATPDDLLRIQWRGWHFDCAALVNNMVLRITTYDDFHLTIMIDTTTTCHQTKLDAELLRGQPSTFLTTSDVWTIVPGLFVCLFVCSSSCLFVAQVVSAAWEKIVLVLKTPKVVLTFYINGALRAPSGAEKKKNKSAKLSWHHNI